MSKLHTDLFPTFFSTKTNSLYNICFMEFLSSAGITIYTNSVGSRTLFALVGSQRCISNQTACWGSKFYYGVTCNVKRHWPQLRGQHSRFPLTHSRLAQYHKYLHALWRNCVHFTAAKGSRNSCRMTTFVQRQRNWNWSQSQLKFGRFKKNYNFYLFSFDFIYW